MSTFDVRVLTEPEYPAWDQLVQESGQGTIFHTSLWVTTVSELFKVDYVIIGVFNSSELIGGCSFYIKHLLPGYTIAYTLNNLTPYGGIVIGPQKSSQIRECETREHETISLILEKIEGMNLAKVNLINGPGLVDIRPFTGQGWGERVFYTYIVPLENDIFLHASYGARRSIRKARKLGLSVNKEYNPDIFWKLAIATFAKQNLNVPYTKEQVFTLMEMFIQNKLGDMWIARTPSGEAVSAVFYIYDSHMAHGWLGVNDPGFKDTGVVSLVLFESLCELKNRGFQRFNIMAANTPHLAQFYSSFNPLLVPYYGIEKMKGLGKLSCMFRFG
jgi:hypothetical protein